MEPVAILGDSTGWDGHSDSDSTMIKYPAWYGVDASPGKVWAATGRGWQVWDVSNPGAPSKQAQVYLPTALGLHWQHSDKDQYVKEIAADPRGDLAVLSGEEQGVIIVAPSTVLYQDGVQLASSPLVMGKWGLAVVNGKVARYDLDVARELHNCYDLSQANQTSCGPWRGYLAGVTAFQVSGAGPLLAAARYTRLDLWRLDDPDHPAMVPLGLTIPTGEARLWRVGSTYYLGAFVGAWVRLYNVTCAVTAGSCPAVPEIGAYHLPSTDVTSLTFSETAGKRYLYVGSQDTTATADAKEFLLDITDPAHPIELSPQEHPGGYWQWYYQFQAVAPSRAVVVGGYLYRAGLSLMDVHRLRSRVTVFSDGFENGSSAAWRAQ